jgi:hypothetical protein
MLNVLYLENDNRLAILGQSLHIPHLEFHSDASRSDRVQLSAAGLCAMPKLQGGCHRWEAGSASVGRADEVLSAAGLAKVSMAELEMEFAPATVGLDFTCRQ